MDIERVATNCIESLVSKSDYLVSHINSGDKEPSWDGDIEVYTTPGDTHSKDDLYLKVPVQIKGFKSNNLKKHEITYPIDIADLRNYLQVGGTIYFVVYADPSTDNHRIYYARLLPFELKKILKQYGHQRSRRIKLKPFPTDIREITDVLLSFAQDMQKQKTAISTQPVSWETLQKDGLLKEITFGCKAVPRKDRLPFDHMFNHGMYLYAKLPLGIELPIEHIEHLDSAQTTIDEPVSVNGTVYYNSYNIVYKKDIIELHFGKSICQTISRTNHLNQHFTFKLAGTLTERIKDESFMIDVIKTGQLAINGVECLAFQVTPEELAAFDLPRREEHLAWLKSAKSTLDRLHAKVDLNCSNLTEADELNIALLKDAVIDGKPVAVKDTGSIFGTFTVGNIKLLIAAQKVQDNPKRFSVCSYNDTHFEVKTTSDDGYDVPSSQHILLKKADMLKCCNINYEKVVSDLKQVPFSSKYSEQVTFLLLEMLLAYDESTPKAHDILDAAIDLANYLRDNDPHTPNYILSLNHYQAIKRQRELTSEEQQELINLVETPLEHEEVYVGAYLLLENQAAAEMHFNKLSSELQETIQKYPIYYFWKGTSLSRNNID